MAMVVINVTTGGNDMSLQGGGIGINLVTKRGTNRFHGGARYLLVDDSMASSNIPDELAGDARLQGAEFADHVKNLKDFGFPVNENWDGKSSMLLTVIPDEHVKVEGDPAKAKEELLAKLTPRQRALRKQFLEALGKVVDELAAEMPRER